MPQQSISKETLLREKYPGRIPILAIWSRGSNDVSHENPISTIKTLFPGDLTLRDFLAYSRRAMECSNGSFITVGEERIIPSLSQNISVIDKYHKCNDDILRIHIQNQPVFG